MQLWHHQLRSSDVFFLPEQGIEQTVELLVIKTPIRLMWLHYSGVSPNCERHTVQVHDDVIKWNHFPHYWPFMREIHRSPMNSPHKGQWRGALMFFFYLRPNKRLSKQSWGWWFETPSCPLWSHCNVGDGINPDVYPHTKRIRCQCR